MKTIASLVKQAVKDTPFLEEALDLGIINQTALARKIRAKIEALAYKKIGTGAIVMALQRLKKPAKHNLGVKNKNLLPVSLSLKSGITEFVFKLNTNYFQLQKQVLQSIKKDLYLVSAQGENEATLFISSEGALEVYKHCQKDDLLFRLDQQSVIILRFSQNTIKIPGVYYNLLKALAWENVPVNEVISVGNELSLVFEDDHIAKAFEVIKPLIKS